jgi:nicotinate (nicotinamide) nucleotide adenylyltransferase
MQHERLSEVIARAQTSSEPVIEFLERSRIQGSRVGVFASSFNPLTSAHVELMLRAIRTYELDEVLALAGVANADKRSYECPLEDRLAMLLLAFGDVPAMSIGVSSHAYFVDVVEGLEHLYPTETEFYFILGFDTFERVLDLEGRYIPRYHRSFPDRNEALRFLLERSRLIVAGRAGAADPEVGALIRNEAREIAERILYLEIPSEIAARSATEVRDLIRSGQSIAGLVPPVVETYIAQRGIYRK